MLSKCQAYIVAQTPRDVTALESLCRRVGFTHCFDIGTSKGTLAEARRVSFFFVHYAVPDADMLSVMSAIRASRDDDVRFSPFVVIANDCPFEDVLRYVRLGFDDVVSLPEKAPILQHRLETLLTSEQTYFETETYFGPDRRRLEASEPPNSRRVAGGSKHIRYRLTRDPEKGLRIVQDFLNPR